MVFIVNIGQEIVGSVGDWPLIVIPMYGFAKTVKKKKANTKINLYIIIFFLFNS